MKTSSFAIVLLVGCGPSMPSGANSPTNGKYRHPPADVSLKPAGSGWFCTYHADRADIHHDPEPSYAPCFRTEAECDAQVNRNVRVFATCEATPTAFCYTRQQADHVEGAGIHPRVVVGWKGEFECDLTLVSCNGITRADKVANQIEFSKTDVGNISMVKDISPCTAWN